MTGRVAELSAVAGLGLGLTLGLAGSVIPAPSERVFGQEIVGRHHDPFSTMRHFAGPMAGGVYLQPLTDVPGAVLASSVGPVAAYNLLVLLSFPLSMVAAYLLGRHLGLAPPAATLAAAAFAFSPFHVAQAAYHAHIAQTQWIPLYLLALWRSLDRATPGALAWLAAAVAGVTLSNFYGGLIAAGVTVPAALGYWGFGPAPDPRARRLAIVAATLMAAGAAGIAFATYSAPAVIAAPAAFAYPPQDLVRYGARWWSYLVPPLAHPVFGGFAADVWNRAGVNEGRLEQQVALGWGFIGLAGVALFAWIRRGAATSKASACVPVLAVVAVAAFVCSLAPAPPGAPLGHARPSAWIHEVLPMFRSYARFGVVVQLMTVLLAAIGLQQLWAADRRLPHVAAFVLLVLAAAEYAVWPPSLSRDVLPTAAHRWVARQSGDVRVLDCSPLTLESESVQWLTANRVSMRNEMVDECTAPHAAERLVTERYTHVLVRQGTPEARWVRASGAPDGMVRAARFRSGEVFRLTGPPALVYTGRMDGFYPREYDGARTWRWMRAEAAWDVVQTGATAVVASADVELDAFRQTRRLRILLDGRERQTLVVESGRGIARIGPFVLTPGHHRLAFHPTEGAVAASAAGAGDHRPLSFAFGAWQWIVE